MSALKCSKVIPVTVIDYDFLSGYKVLERKGAPSVLHSLIDRFFDSAPKRLKLIKDCLDQRNLNQLICEAHAFRGSAGYVGAARLAQLCESIEDAARVGSLGNTCAAWEELCEETESALRELRAIRFS